MRLLPTREPTVLARREHSRGRHLAQIDLVRVLTFSSVVAVHTISMTSDPHNVVANALLTFLHFNRATFVFLTGFVLVYTYRDRAMPPAATRKFWRRRMVLVGVPYLVWTVGYFLLGQVGAPTPTASDAFTTLLEDIYRGVGWYHLYFLMVSLQFYLLFPMVLRVLRATVGHHRLVFAASVLAQVGITGAWTYLIKPDQGGLFGTLWTNQGTLIVSYQLYAVAGCLAAYHFEAFHAWVLSHSRLVLWLVIGSATLVGGWYFVGIAAGGNPWDVTGVLQPEMIPWFCAMILGLYWLGASWHRRGHSGLGHRLVSAASVRSFGVFLVHPAFIWLVGWLGNDWFAADLSPLVNTVFTYLFALAGSLAVVELVIHTPLSRVLIGRDQLRTKAPRPAAVPAA